MTKKQITIGQGVAIDLDRLVSTRLLVQANSGGGKSWALRRLLEQTHGAVQQIVIDPEGEFATLRERFDYILAARQGGDTLADPRTAKLLAERLLELGVSAILDIYELQPRERVSFVKIFLEALVDAPKQLWHPVLVVLDEAHVFAPEQGHGEAESDEAVKGLATRGRKRGFCLVAATQRLSKLHKDVAAECNNKLIGRTALDVDMKRAGAELGFVKGDLLQLRDLEDGEFFAFGPALSKTITRVKVGPVQTTHPKAGSKLAAVVPPPTAKVKAVLSKLADLPAEAEAREKTVADLKREITTLKRDVIQAKKAQPTIAQPSKTDVARAEKIADLKQQLARRQRALDEAMKILVKISAVDFPIETEDERKALEQAIAAAVRQVTGPIEKRVTALAARVEGIKTAAKAAEQAIGALLEEKLDLAVQVQRREPFEIAGRPGAQPGAIRPGRPNATRPAATSERGRSESVASGNSDLGKGERRVLAAVAQHPDGVTREQLTVLTGYTRSSRNTYIQRLGAAGLVDVGDRIRATDAGVAELGDFEPLPTGSALANHWRRELPAGELAVLEQLLKAYPNPVDRERLSELTGYTRSSRNTYLQRLSARELVVSDREGVRAVKELFD